jgi:hypothetical protein
MAASTVAIARMPSSKISRPDTGLRRPHCARRLADEDAASAAAEEDVVEHVTVAHVHAGGPACAVPCLTWARFVSRPLVGHRPVSDGTPTAGRRSDRPRAARPCRRPGSTRPGSTRSPRASDGRAKPSGRLALS